MRKGWETKIWGEVLEIRSGRNQKEVLNPDGKYPILGSAGKIMGYADDFICEAGTTIVGRKGTINNPLFIEERFWNVDTAFGLHTHEDLDKSFLHYFCLSFDFTQLDKGSGRPSLVKSDLLKIEIPIPPLQEQKQIVAILDKAFTAIDQAKANIEKNIENAKELFQSKLNEIFSQTGEGWVEKSLGEVCMKTKNIRWQDHKNKEYQYVDLSSVSRETLEVTETAIVNDMNAPSRAKKIIKKGDVIFATTRPTLKRATIIDEELDGQICSTGYAVLRPNERISTDWIFFYLLTSTFMDRMETLQRGASYPAVSDTDVKGSTLSIPTSKMIESKYVVVMNEIRERTNELVLQYYAKLNSLEELKKSILQKAFAGELTNKEVEV